MRMMNLPSRLTLQAISLYQRINSAFPQGKFSGCRYHPTCSAYTYQAVLKYGTIRGLFLGFKRILRCNPLFKGGEDPLN